MSSERLPALTQIQPQGTSSASSSPRGGSYASSVYNGSLSSATSYTPSVDHSGSPAGTPHSYAARDGSSLHDQHDPPYGQQSVNGFGFGVDYQNSMNHIGPYNTEVHHTHMATTHAHPPTSGPATGLGHYPSYQPPLLQPGHSNYTPTYGGYSYTGLPAPQPATSMSSALVPQAHTLPAMSSAPGATALAGTQNYPGHQFDTTGQIAPNGAKPRVTATLWEDEGSLCFQVEAKGICVARREDNHMINGTKLLNVAGMTRGRRDGILKSEKIRHVVKIGPMHLKGVWIPFDRALDFANKEKITEVLYPLFVHDIGALLYHPTNPNRAAVGGQTLDRRRNDQRYMTTPHTPQTSSVHHHTMSTSIVGSVPPPPQPVVRPGIDRAHTFPTPPTSASSVMAIGNQGGSYDSWGSSSVTGQPLSIDTGLSNARSVPTTPASTPPGNTIQGTPQYQTSQSYDSSRPVYSAPAGQQAQYPVAQGRYGVALPLPSASAFPKSEMAPPAKTGEEEAEHEQEGEYTHTNAQYSANRTSYAYNPNQGTGPLKTEVVQVAEELTSSPHQNGSGRATPRTAGTTQAAWQGSYSTPQRNAAPASSLYNVVDAANGDQAYYSGGSFSNGLSTGKRVREMDDEEIDDSAKRQKTENSEGGPVGGSPYNMNRPRAAVSQRRAR